MSAVKNRMCVLLPCAANRLWAVPQNCLAEILTLPADSDRVPSEISWRGVDVPVMDFGADGNVCLNIAIRTIIIANGKAYAQTGGGIVADSDSKSEWDETITKARALLAGITAVNKKH